MTAIAAPSHSEFATYYRTYTDLVPDGPILEILERQFPETRDLLLGVPPEKERFRYGEGKWSIREVVGHCIDTERVFGFRALWIARGAVGGQPGMDQDLWVGASTAHERPLSALVEEWQGLRADMIRMFRSFDAEGLARTGTASRRSFTARSFAWIIAGHELHHRRLLRQRYGLG